MTRTASTQVTIHWNASTDVGGSGVKGYYIYRDGANVGSSANTSFTDTTTAGSTSYSYAVQAYDYAMNLAGPSANLIVTTPDTLPPNVPTGLHFTLALATKVILEWSPSSDVGGSSTAGYHVYRNGAYLGSTSSTSYTDTTVTAATSYTYTVSAYDYASNTSAQSAGASVTTQVEYIPITDGNRAIVPAAVGRYQWSMSCGTLGGIFPYCDFYLIKIGYGSVWSWRIAYTGAPVPNCPQGSGAAGYQQIAGTCIIQALPSVY